MTIGCGVPTEVRGSSEACHALAHVAARVVGAVVLDVQVADALDQRSRHPGERRFHAGKAGVAALGGNFQRIQHRRVRRVRRVAHVGVPQGLAVAERADRLARLVAHVGDHVDVGIARRGLAPRALVRRRVERAEMLRERQQVVVGQLLVPENKDIVPVPRLFDGLDFPRGGAGEVDTLDFGADRAEGADFQVEYGCHCASPCFLGARIRICDNIQTHTGTNCKTT